MYPEEWSFNEHLRFTSSLQPGNRQCYAFRWGFGVPKFKEEPGKRQAMHSHVPFLLASGSGTGKWMSEAVLPNLLSTSGGSVVQSPAALLPSRA